MTFPFSFSRISSLCGNPGLYVSDYCVAVLPSPCTRPVVGVQTGRDPLSSSPAPAAAGTAAHPDAHVARCPTKKTMSLHKSPNTEMLLNWEKKEGGIGFWYIFYFLGKPL